MAAPVTACLNFETRSKPLILLVALLIADRSLVPVYDGRTSGGKPFGFTPADFDGLPAWPLYKKGRAEIPHRSVVTVGYTVGHYFIGETKWVCYLVALLPLS